MTLARKTKKVFEDVLHDTNLDHCEILSVDLPKEQPGKIGVNPWRLKRDGRIEMTASRIKKKYQRQRQKGSLKKKTNKKTNKKSTKW